MATENGRERIADGRVRARGPCVAARGCSNRTRDPCGQAGGLSVAAQGRCGRIKWSRDPIKGQRNRTPRNRARARGGSVTTKGSPFGVEKVRSGARASHSRARSAGPAPRRHGLPSERLVLPASLTLVRSVPHPPPESPPAITGSKSGRRPDSSSPAALEYSPCNPVSRACIDSRPDRAALLSRNPRGNS